MMTMIVVVKGARMFVSQELFLDRHVIEGSATIRSKHLKLCGGHPGESFGSL